jgi:hypothetical protein
MNKNWQKVELAYLNRHAKKKSVEELAERFHTTPAEVRAKLKELKILEEAAHGQETLLELYGEAQKALYEQRWAEALQLFEQVAEGTDQADLGARSRQFAEMARARLAEAEAGDDDAEPYLLAVMEKNRGHLEEALELCLAEDRAQKDERFAYLAATCYALQGELEPAAGYLAKAMEAREETRSQALGDPDLAALRDDPKHATLFSEE